MTNVTQLNSIILGNKLFRQSPRLPTFGQPIGEAQGSPVRSPPLGYPVEVVTRCFYCPRSPVAYDTGRQSARLDGESRLYLEDPSLSGPAAVSRV